MMRLINAPPSPYGRKVAILLREKNIPFETIWDEPWGEKTITGDHNPLSKLPILITDDGETNYESSYLLEWIERRYPSPSLMPSDDDGILTVKKLMVLADGVMEATAATVRELGRPGMSNAWIERQRSKITRATEVLEETVAGRTFAFGDRFGQADIAIAVNLIMIDTIAELFGAKIEIKRWRDRLPRLADYVDRLDQRPSFVATRPMPMPFNAEKVYG